MADQTVCVGASALRYLGWRLHHMYDQHIWCGFIPAHRLFGGKYTILAYLYIITTCIAIFKRQEHKLVLFRIFFSWIQHDAFIVSRKDMINDFPKCIADFAVSLSLCKTFAPTLYLPVLSAQ